MRLAPTPAVRNCETACSTSAVGPEITVCLGELWFASTTEDNPASARIFPISGAAAETAAIAPGSPSGIAPMIASARAWLQCSSDSGVSVPAAASAVSSP